MISLTILWEAFRRHFVAILSHFARKAPSCVWQRFCRQATLGCYCMRPVSGDQRALGPLPRSVSRSRKTPASAVTLTGIHRMQDSEGQFPGRLIGRAGVPKERGVWSSQGGRKDKLFSPLHSSGLCNNNVSCLRTVSGKNLANAVMLRCKLRE